MLDSETENRDIIRMTEQTPTLASLFGCPPSRGQMTQFCNLQLETHCPQVCSFTSGSLAPEEAIKSPTR